MVRIPDDLWQQLSEEAAEQRRSVNNLVEVMLRSAIELDPLMDNLADDIKIPHPGNTLLRNQ